MLPSFKVIPRVTDSVLVWKIEGHVLFVSGGHDDLPSVHGGTLRGVKI